MKNWKKEASVDPKYDNHQFPGIYLYHLQKNMARQSTLRKGCERKSEKL